MIGTGVLQVVCYEAGSTTQGRNTLLYDRHICLELTVLLHRLLSLYLSIYSLPKLQTDFLDTQYLTIQLLLQESNFAMMKLSIFHNIEILTRYA